MKKILARVLIISMFVSGVYFLKPAPKAEAIFGIGDISFDPSNLVANLLDYGEQLFSNLIESTLKVAVQKLADKVLDKLVQDTLNWANGGFDGEPGFINNYGDFLKGTEHEILSSSLTAAIQATQDAQNNSGINNSIIIAECISNLGPSPASCNDDYLNDFEGCIFGLDPIEDEEEYAMCEQMRDDMAFAHELCLDQHNEYNQKVAACENASGDPGTQAQQNYNLFINGEVNSSRGVATTIAQFGAKKLNYDPLNSLINGEGETLSALLGSQEAKDAFNYDFDAGGIMGYIALADPHNSSLGKQGLVESALANKTEQKVETKKEDISLVQRYLSKDSCSDGSKPVNGACPEGTQLKTETPGDIVGEQVSNSLKSEQNKASMANGLVDSLVKAIGDLTDGLLDAGLSGLTDTATKAFFSPENSLEEFGGNYQSEYDVLGITNDIGNNGGSGGPNSPGGPGGGPNNSDLFIGGPEHTKGGYGTQPQIIVDFEADLEKNIEYLLDEQKYYGDLRRLLIKSADVLYEFDKCIPGADYDWEQRYKDVMPLSGNEVTEEEDVNISHKIGFNEQKNMIEDPKVTIPGGVTLMNQHRNILRITQDNSVANGARLDQVNSSIASLEYIKQTILELFNQQRLAYDAPLVLFASDWNNENYSEQDKIKSLQAAEKNGFFISFNTQDSLMTDQQARQVLQDNEKKALEAVLKMSWEIWRNETAAEDKLELRKAFYVTRTQLSSEELVATAKIKADQLYQAINNSYKLALDCMVFKMYALGISRDYIAGIVFGPKELENKVLESAAVINQYDPIDVGTTTNTQGEIIAIGGAIAGGPILGTIGGWLGGGRDTLDQKFFNVDNARSNEAILSFLESEFNLKQQNLPSVFTTTNMINPEAIEKSILGFESTAERNKYFNLYYPELSGYVLPEDGTVGRGGPFGGRGPLSLPNADYVTINKFDIAEMYRVDRVYAAGNRIQDGMRGFLFCRTPGRFQIVNNDGRKNDMTGSRCYNAYYSASKLDYRLLISGINKGLAI